MDYINSLWPAPARRNMVMTKDDELPQAQIDDTQSLTIILSAAEDALSSQQKRIEQLESENTSLKAEAARLQENNSGLHVRIARAEQAYTEAHNRWQELVELTGAGMRLSTTGCIHKAVCEWIVDAERARQQAVEECAAAQCEGCRSSIPLNFDTGCHYWPDAVRGCDALAIRVLTRSQSDGENRNLYDLHISEVMRIIQGGLTDNKAKVSSYALLYAQKLEADGHESSAARIRKLVENPDGNKVRALARQPAGAGKGEG
jgi:FtsZ-binding cell division protein ZapB